MRRRKFTGYFTLLLGLVPACGVEGPPGSQGMQGPPGPPGPQGPMGAMGLPGNGSMISCAPGKTFCDGAKIWACTKSGTDAILTMDCAVDLGPANGNTATNPFSCFSSSCPDSGYGSRPGPACCRRTKYLCVASFTSNPALDFSTHWGAPDGCGIGSGSGCYQTGVPTFGIQRKVGSEQVYVSLWFFPDKIKPGQTVSLAELNSLPPACDGTQAVSVTSGGKTCTSWSGSVIWTSPNPSYAVTLDLACTETGKTDMKLKGTFRGDI